MVEPGSRPGAAAGLRIDAIEVLPTDLRSVLLRVAGAWEGPPPQDLATPVLVLRAPDRVHRIVRLPETSGAAARAAPEPQPFRAAFSVPDALAPLLEAPVELDLGTLTVRLPAPAGPDEDAEDEAGEGTVVDRAVLAERRARRAELAEAANLQRAGAAEHTAGQLEGELAKLELRLAEAARERAELEAGVAAQERATEAAETEAAELRERLRGLEAERGELEARAAEVARAERETATTRSEIAHAMARATAVRRELEALRAELAEERRRAVAPPSVEAVALAERAIAEARDAVGAAQAEAERERAEAAAAEAVLHGQLGTLADGVAELRTALDRAGADFGAILESERALRRAAEARADQTAARLAEAERRLAARAPDHPSAPWLPDALRRLLRRDQAAAARLALELLPGQALVVDAPLDYDVVVGGLGAHRVTVAAGAGELAALTAPRGRRAADFRVATGAAGLVRLVVQGGTPPPAGVRVAGTLLRRRALRRLPAVPLGLGALARAGVLPDPGLLYRALAEAIDPAWTRGHRFTVTLDIAGPRGGMWQVTAADGARVTVAESAPDARSDAALRTSQVGLQHLLDHGSLPPGERAAIRGDAEAIGLLGQWTDRARRGGAGRPV